MKIFKRMISSILTAISVMSMTSFPSVAANETALLGDVNGDGRITGMDAIYIQQYINGMNSPTRKQFTAMDANGDGVIDNTDAQYIISTIAVGDIGIFNVTRELYTLPNNQSIAYRKHNCSSSSSNSYTTYTLSAITNKISSVEDIPSVLADNGGNVVDNENVACVKLKINNYNGAGSFGSGFIVGDNVIATAAHSLYDSTGFMKNVTAEINTQEVRNGKLTDVTYTAQAKALHIPSNYDTSTNGEFSYDVNYDYGLVYFDGFIDPSGNVLDLTDYKVQFGVMSDYFENEAKGVLTTVGFADYNNEFTRYQCTGKIVPMQNGSSEYLYRYHILAQGLKDKIGGMTYFDSNAWNNKINNRSVVGIFTQSVGSTDSYGVKITPTLLRFYLQNNNI